MRWFSYNLLKFCTEKNEKSNVVNQQTGGVTSFIIDIIYSVGTQAYTTHNRYYLSCTRDAENQY